MPPWHGALTRALWEAGSCHLGARQPSLAIGTVPSPWPPQTLCTKPPELLGPQPAPPSSLRSDSLRGQELTQQPLRTCSTAQRSRVRRETGEGTEDRRRQGGLWVGGVVGESICRSKDSWDCATSWGLLTGGEPGSLSPPPLHPPLSASGDWGSWDAEGSPQQNTWWRIYSMECSSAGKTSEIYPYILTGKMAKVY